MPEGPNKVKRRFGGGGGDSGAGSGKSRMRGAQLPAAEPESPVVSAPPPSPEMDPRAVAALGPIESAPEAGKFKADLGVDPKGATPLASRRTRFGAPPPQVEPPPQQQVSSDPVPSECSVVIVNAGERNIKMYAETPEGDRASENYSSGNGGYIQVPANTVVSLVDVNTDETLCQQRITDATTTLTVATSKTAAGSGIGAWPMYAKVAVGAAAILALVLAIAAAVYIIRKRALPTRPNF